MTDSRTMMHTETRAEVLSVPSSAQFTAMLEFAETMIKSGFLPAEIKTAAQAVAVILCGRELGIPPMQALRSVYIVKGKPVVAADLQLALFKRGGGAAHFAALDERCAKLVLRHPNGDEHTEVFTIEDAKRAGLLSSPNYLKHPKAMLRSRAITAGLKSIGFEPTSGVYGPGELEEELRQEAPFTAALEAAALEGAPVEGADPSEPEGEPEDERISRQQLLALRSLLHETFRKYREGELREVNAFLESWGHSSSSLQVSAPLQWPTEHEYLQMAEQLAGRVNPLAPEEGFGDAPDPDRPE